MHSPSRPRLDHLDGIRGLAIALVVVFHVFVGRVSAGVDVFLFVGGLLLLAPRLRKVEDPHGPTLLQSLVLLLRRLVPALITVVAVTCAGVLLLYRRTNWEQWLADASASLLYTLNWRLIGIESDYEAASASASPFQHLWSMSVQLQIYLAVIVLAFAVHAAAQALRRGRLRSRAPLPSARPASGRSASARNTSAHSASAAGPRAVQPRWARTVVLLVAAATIASFAYAAWLSSTGDQSAGYYSTLTRFWEIGAGALLGLWVLRSGSSALRSATARSLCAWVGLALVLSVGAFMDGAQQFPGPLALIPLVGAFLLIIAGMGPTAPGPHARPALIRVLESPLFARLGTLAYSLYLWHWPVLILTVQATGLEARNPLVGIPVIVVSLALAQLTHTWIEEPMRVRGRTHARVKAARSRPGPASRHSPVSPRSPVSRPGPASRHSSPPTAAAREERRPRRPRRPSTARVLLASSFVVTVASPGALAKSTELRTAAEEQRMDAMVEEGRPDSFPGAAAVLEGIEPRADAPVFPGLASRTPMMTPGAADKCITPLDDDALTFDKADGTPCHYGDVESERTLYVVGGSHSEHWLGPLDEIGQEYGVRIITLLRGRCPLYLAEYDDAGCQSWSQQAERFIFENPPTEGVFTVSTRPAPLAADEPEHVPDEYIDVLDRITAAGITVFAMRDNPWLRDDDLEQLDARVCVSLESTPEACAIPAERALSETNPAEAALSGEGYVHLDLSDLFVQDGMIPPVVGNVLVYRDSNHLTDQFARTTKPELERQMLAGHTPASQ